MDLQLKDKVAIVTGGSRGIGKAVARELLRAGARVVIAARDLGALERSASELAAESQGIVVPIAYDAASDASVRAMVAGAVEALGGIDILVNAAARPDLPPRPTLDRIDDDTFFGDIDVKVMGYLRCIREVAPHLAARGGGRIVSVGGMSAFLTGSTIGSVRNLAVASLTTSLAEELAPQNIQLNVVHPGATRTERTAEAIAGHAAARGISVVEAEAALNASTLLGRIVDAREVAEVVTFLSSPKAAAINGEAIAVAGGMRGVVRF
jgi:NAD(P)-dependent dehydrogenase (short-subunit alcohol dehydrogenase family)